MARNGTGTFTRLYSWEDDRDSGVKIRADRMDDEDDGFATGLTDSIAKDGQTTPTANLPMGGFKHTGVADGTAANHYASVGQLQDNLAGWADAGGTADAITATFTPTVTALTNGMMLGVRAAAANATTTPTFKADATTARTIVKEGGAALVAGDIAADGHELLLRYDLANTRWELLNPASAELVKDTTPQLGGPLDTNSHQVRWSKGADIASPAGGALTLGTDGNYFDITGTNTITSIGTVGVGTVIKLQFDSALTLTHSPSVLHLPGGADITTATRDNAEFVEHAPGWWRCTSYFRAAYVPLTQATNTVAGVVEKATQAEVEAETADKYPDAALIKNSPGVAKVWALVDRSAGTPTLSSPSHNVTSVTDNGAARTTVTIATDFSSAVYAPGANALAGAGRFCTAFTLAAGSFEVLVSDHTGANPDTTDFTCWAFGDQA